MNSDDEGKAAPAPLAASLTGFTDKLIADQDVVQSNTLFAGQIGAAAKALAARTNSVGVGGHCAAILVAVGERRIVAVCRSLRR